MNGNLSRKGENSKNFTVNFFNNTPETKSVIFLGSTRIAFSITRIHHSFLIYGRFRKTSFSK